jgi:hypothetical protein
MTNQVQRPEPIEGTRQRTHVPEDEHHRRHVPRLIRSQDVRQRVHGSGAVGRFNSRLAVVITKLVGTMWAAYLFTLIALVSLPQALSAFVRGDTVTGIN